MVSVILFCVLPYPLPDPLPLPLAGSAPAKAAVASWEPAGPVEPHRVACATCPSGYRFTGQLGQWFRRGKTWAYAIADGDRTPIGWWIYDRDPPRWIPASNDDREKVAVRPLDDPVNRRAVQRYHYRLSPGSCGMLGCRVHGGGLTLVPD